MRRKSLMLFVLVVLVVGPMKAQTPMQVFGVWHCYSDGCNWLSVPNMTTFDSDNHWLIDRGDGVPAVNVVVLSFVNPVDLMNLANSSNTVNGIPVGMNASVVNYFESKGVRVMFSIGGIRFVKDWDKALSARCSLALTPPMRRKNSTWESKSTTRKAAIPTYPACKNSSTLTGQFCLMTLRGTIRLHG